MMKRQSTYGPADENWGLKFSSELCKEFAENELDTASAIDKYLEIEETDFTPLKKYLLLGADDIEDIDIKAIKEKTIAAYAAAICFWIAKNENLEVTNENRTCHILNVGMQIEVRRRELKSRPKGRPPKLDVQALLKTYFGESGGNAADAARRHNISPKWARKKIKEAMKSRTNT